MENKNTGFTIIELIIALTISVVILGIIFSMFIVSNKIFNSVDVNSDLQTEAHNVEEKVKSVGMQAMRIDGIDLVSGQIKDFGEDSESRYKDLTNLTDIKGNSLSGSVSDNEKYLKIKDISITTKEEEPESNPIQTKNVSYVIKYYSNDKKLTITKAGEPEQDIGKDIENITIKPSNTSEKLSQADSIQLNINFAKKKGFSDIKYSIPINITFRNK